jgi:hypothetical protein
MADKLDNRPGVAAEPASLNARSSSRTTATCWSNRAMRSILLAPGPVARAVALGASTREQRWMLAQSREVRRSYVEHVVDEPGDPNAQMRWMLSQTDAIRLSYVREVLANDPDAPPEQAWMLKQPRKVRESYVREVLERS